MIRNGRAEGWLKLPSTACRTWAAFNRVSFDGIKIASMPHRGTGVVAERDLHGGEEAPLMVVPRDLVLSRQTVHEHAKYDADFRQVLEAFGPFGRTARGAILSFLLMQATVACPSVPHGVGVQNPWTEYIKLLPYEDLPTFWTEEEYELLLGTSLRPAVSAKLKSLRREFDHFREATKHIGWCQKYWWDESKGLLTFDDWKQVDAMYRTRALNYPQIGECMAPCIDMANHASGTTTAALWEVDGAGNAILLLRDGIDVKAGREVTITYGDDKGACEMIFSYGFIEDSTTSAKVVLLDLSMLEDDPLGLAKMNVLTAAPGCRVYDRGSETSWESDFVWLICVNEEDGLSFDFLESVDGNRELKAFWKGKELEDTSRFHELLVKDDLWDLYQLRATAIIQERVERQLLLFHRAPDIEDSEDGIDEEGKRRRSLISSLRSLETDLLERAYGDLEDQKLKLLDSDVVRQYLDPDDAAKEFA